MEDIKQSTVNSEQSTVEQKRPITVHGSQPTFLVTLLSVLLLISCLIAGFFAYQTQRLVAELRMKNEELVIKTPTPVSTPDSTADWKEYSYTKIKFSLKLPQKWYTHPETSTLYGYDTNISFPVDNPSSQDFIDGQLVDLSIGVSNNNSEDLQAIANNRIIMPNSYLNNKVANITVDNENAIVLDYKSGDGHEIVFKHGDYNYIISFFNPNKNKELFEIFDQIISTFKFIEPEIRSSSLPVACTMDAKICPDGTSVGRTGPKCEFAPCPAPIN